MGCNKKKKRKTFQKARVLFAESPFSVEPTYAQIKPSQFYEISNKNIKVIV